MGEEHVKAAARHATALRCALCHSHVDPELQAPCDGCGSVQHPDCRVQHGGCTTLGCAHAPRVVEAEGQAARQGSALPSLPTAAAWSSMGAGAVGMVLSFLALGAGGLEAMAGAAGFVAGAVLIACGLVAATVLGLRRDARAIQAIAGAPPAAVSAILGRLSLLAGAGGMLVAFLFCASAHAADVLAGAAGFVAGALLLGAGLVTIALAAKDEPRR